MPTFDFLCSACNHTFEFSRPFGSTKQPKCPECGSKKTEKQIAPPAIQFKGSGFYKTDSRGSTPAIAVPKKESEKKEAKETKETKEQNPVKESSKNNDRNLK